MNDLDKIKLDKNKLEHLYIQLYKIIKSMIVAKDLSPNEKLPPIRRLAKQLEVNNVTIVSAYELLEQEGLIYKKIGSGTYVSSDITLQRVENERFEKKKKEGSLLSLVEHGHIQLRKNTINFASTTPTAELFPVDDFKKLINEVLDRDKGYAFEYQESQGYFPLRQELVNYLKNYDIFTRVECLQIISGAQQGIDIVSKVLLSYNDAVIVEKPSYTGAIAAFQSRGANIIGVGMEEDGLDTVELEEKIIRYKPKFLYLMPNFQNPTGLSYSREKKENIVSLCRKYNTYVVEDDYLTDLNFYSEDNSTLKSLDYDNQHVIYIKSFSKIFMPGLRIGFLAAPSQLNKELWQAKHSTDISTSSLLQRALELYFKKGAWHNNLKLMKFHYRERFDMMMNCIQKYMPSKVKYTLPQGGINFWFQLPDYISAEELYKITMENDVAFAPGYLFFIHDEGNSYFRLSVAATTPNEIEEGMKKLGKLIENFILDPNEHRLANRYTPIL